VLLLPQPTRLTTVMMIASAIVDLVFIFDLSLCRFYFTVMKPFVPWE
jgi:hypothetical protein